MTESPLTYEAMAARLAAGQSLKTMVAADEKAWAGLYRQAYSLYKYGRYRQAEPLFQLLVLAEPDQGRNWVALGAVQKKLGKYEKALNTFVAAIQRGIRNPWLPLHAAECQMRFKRCGRALVHLNQALDCLGGPDAARILARIRLLFEQIEKRT